MNVLDKMYARIEVLKEALEGLNRQYELLRSAYDAENQQACEGIEDAMDARWDVMLSKVVALTPVAAAKIVANRTEYLVELCRDVRDTLADAGDYPRGAMHDLNEAVDGDPFSVALTREEWEAE